MRLRLRAPALPVASRLTATVSALGLLLHAGSSEGAKPKPWVPHPVTVVPGKPMKPEDIKPYTPPKLAAEPAPQPSTAKSVVIQSEDAAISARPWSSPLVGTAQKGAHLAIRGQLTPKNGGCKLYYALEPFGWICSREAVASDEPPTTEPVLKVREGSRLPFQYVMVLVKEGDKIPMWASVEALQAGEEPERQLENGDTVAIEKPLKLDDQQYWVSVEGKVLPQKGTGTMGGGAQWHGVDLDDQTPLPFGWITPDRANVYVSPPAATGKPKPDAQLARRTRVQIIGEQRVGKRTFLQVTIAAPPPPMTYGDIFESQAKKGAAATAPVDDNAAAAALPSLWVAADAVNEARLLPRPATVPEGVTRWIDVDLGEQVLVLYDQDKPVWATLVSSGRAIPTPMGTYPVWAKVAAITMKNQPYEDKGYFVNKVPWSTFFQWHNAIHGAYWHDRFGAVKSHGCVNVAPADAKHIFEWVTPALPPGWTGFRPENLLTSPTVVTRNSHLPKQFRQDRPIGPPDRALEGQRLTEAEKRRADAAADPAAATGGLPAAGSAAPAPTTPTAPAR